MKTSLDQRALDQLFLTARTHSAWLPQPVGDDVLRQLYDLMRMAPTSANCSPTRIVFLRTPESKQRLRPTLSPGNVDKTMSAPVTAIIGYDLRFYEQMHTLFPHRDLQPTFAADPVLTEATAFRNSSLQGAYFMLAARALGLDCGPMSGFDQAAVDQEFFPQGKVRTNFLCNLGYGERGALFPRLPRLSFEDACTLL
ncbi:MAG: malonic semialdehyde reductase [Pseudomonadota bacterium]